MRISLLLLLAAVQSQALHTTPKKSTSNLQSFDINTPDLHWNIFESSPKAWQNQSDPDKPRIPRRCRKCPGYPHGNSTHPPASPGFEDVVGYWGVVGTIGILVLMGGVLAGLTIGYFSLDETMLAILERSGTPKEQRQAGAIRPIRENTHLLLVTLLLANVVVNETMPILFHSIDLEGWQAVLASTALIVMFGEIIPQAVCARYGLAIGSFFAWPIWIVECILFPIAWPIAKLLDWILGANHETRYKRSQLKELVALHASSEHGPLEDGEVRYLRNILDMQSKTVENVYTKLENVFSLELSTRMDRKVLQRVFDAGHSRIPVFVNDPSRILGCILAKNLILVDPDDAVQLKSLPLRRLPVVSKDTGLWEMLKTFEQGGSHMAVVVDGEEVKEDPSESTPLLKEEQPKQVLGIVCMEDVLEELLGEEIIDETDVFIDMNNDELVKKDTRMVSEFEKRRRGVSPAALRGISPAALHPYSPALQTPSMISPSLASAHAPNLSPNLTPKDHVQSMSTAALGPAMLESQPSLSLVPPGSLEPSIPDRTINDRPSSERPSGLGERTVSRSERFGKKGMTAGELLGIKK